MPLDPLAYDPTTDPFAVPRNSAQVEQILATVTNKNAQIDAIYDARGCIKVGSALRDTLDAYLAGSVPVDETVNLLAAPIEASYSSADQGYLLWEAEATARCMRPLCATADESLQFWGEPVALCEPDPARRPRCSLESQLWDLYFAIIHASRKLDWTITARNDSMAALVRLVQELKARPDPPAPENATAALHNYCVCAAGALWSGLCMLGPSAAEMQSEAPGGKLGFTAVESRAWENENAFFALLTAAGTVDFMVYGVGALRDALEGGIARRNQVRMTREFKAEWMDVTLGVVGVWMDVAGEEMFARVRGWGETEEREVVVENGMTMEWKGELTAARWEVWKRRLAELSREDGRSEKAKGDAMRALDRMHDSEAISSAQ